MGTEANIPENKNAEANASRLYWTEEELAAELSVSTRTLKNFRARRLIPFIKIGAVVRYERAGVKAALARQTVQARA